MLMRSTTQRILGFGSLLTALAFACDNSSIDDSTSGGSSSSGDASNTQSQPSDEKPVPNPSASKEGNVITYAATSFGLAGFGANGRIQPHGKPTEYYFEYGPTAAYGSKTPKRAVPPKLEAHYREAWDSGLAGWRGGGGDELLSRATGGLSRGYVRFAEPSGTDYNHVDGIGLLHLCQYFYIGTTDGDAPSAALGGSAPDFRDAKVHVAVRGVSFVPRSSELVWWSQIDIAHGNTPAGKDPQYSNWAHTGFTLTDALLSGNWETIDYRLYNDTSDWSYAGKNAALNAEQGRDVYGYAPIDDVLGNLDTDIFHVLTPIEDSHFPTGAIDFDEMEITYRNHSMLYPGNGGKLVRAPEGSTDAAALTDGWRIGEGKMWTTGPNPDDPEELVFELGQLTTIERVQLQQHPDWPAKEIEAYSSPDGMQWTQVVGDVIPEKHAASGIFAYLLVKNITAPPAKFFKVRINSGYKAERWGLGEIEVFGKSGPLPTDDDWYRLTADITGLTRGQAYHFRLVAVNADGTTELGGDQVFSVPADTKPEVRTLPPVRVRDGSAKVSGRMNTLGTEAQWFFEYGPTTAYGAQTPAARTGNEITPRTLGTVLEGLAPGTTVHYRMVATNAAGTSYGSDTSFVVK